MWVALKTEPCTLPAIQCYCYNMRVGQEWEQLYYAPVTRTNTTINLRGCLQSRYIDLDNTHTLDGVDLVPVVSDHPAVEVTRCSSLTCERACVLVLLHTHCIRNMYGVHSDSLTFFLILNISIHLIYGGCVIRCVTNIIKRILIVWLFYFLIVVCYTTTATLLWSYRH